ncbi:MAG: hypothetical protein CBC48_13185 [bacterium TMED88]|nr:MAG: hypothetical protein CBC48_13185 [bacterium TMED88]
MNLVKTESLIEEDALGCSMRQEALLYEDLHQKDDSSYVDEAFDTILLKIMAVTPYPGLKQVIQELYDTRNTAYQRIFKRCFTSCSDVIDRALQDKIYKFLYVKITKKYLASRQTVNVNKSMKDKDLRRESVLVHRKPIPRIAQIKNNDASRINVDLYPNVPEDFILSVDTRYKRAPILSFR